METIPPILDITGKKQQLPFYAKLSLLLLAICLIFTIVYVGQEVLFPVLLALFFAILLRPVVYFLNRRLKFPHVIAAVVSVALFVVFVISVISFVSWQVSDFADDWKSIKRNLLVHYMHLQGFVKERFHVSYYNQAKYLRQATKESLYSSNRFVGETLSSFTGILLNLILIPVYTFLFLLYRNLLLKFLTKLVKEEQRPRLYDVLLHVKIAIQSFLVGLLMEMGIVSALTTIGLMIVGVQYALLLGTITGILNMIPYVGILTAGLLTIFATLTSSTDLSMIIGVIIVNAVVQLIDNNFLVPFIVSSKVKINALISLIAIVTAGAMAGVAGMFLAIPTIAILKVIFDRVDSLEPLGFLMGDDLPKTMEWGKIRLPSLDAGNTPEQNEDSGPAAPGTIKNKKITSKEKKK
jgi:predicted PurR-regulated permease PerM